MKLKKLDKQIIKFAHPLQIKPGYTKRKSLLNYLNLNEKELNESTERLIKLGYIEEYKEKTSHTGVCYKLTDTGINIVTDLNKSIFLLIKDHPVWTTIIAIIVYFFTYFMDLFSDEIKMWIQSFFC